MIWVWDKNSFHNVLVLLLAYQFHLHIFVSLFCKSLEIVFSSCFRGDGRTNARSRPLHASSRIRLAKHKLIATKGHWISTKRSARHDLTFPAGRCGRTNKNVWKSASWNTPSAESFPCTSEYTSFPVCIVPITPQCLLLLTVHATVQCSGVGKGWPLGADLRRVPRYIDV